VNKADGTEPLIKVGVVPFWLITVLTLSVGGYFLFRALVPGKSSQGNGIAADVVTGSGSPGSGQGAKLLITHTFRHKKSGGGMVLQLQNAEPGPLHGILVTCVNPADNMSLRVPLKEWDPGQMFEIGTDETWEITPGQTVTIDVPGYQSTVIKLKKE
jgi:hypothetical protein